MAENEGKSSMTVPWVPLLAMLAAVAGLTALLPSRSARPPAPSDTMAGTEASGVPARLWQDPLSVAWEAAGRAAVKPAPGNPPELDLHAGRLSLAVTADKPAATAPHSFKELTDMYQALADKAGGTLPLVLVACEPNSPYAEDVERRVRDRGGVIHALAAEGYLPEESTSLHYVMVDGRAETVLPFEGFHRLEQAGQQPVLVLWLADGILDKGGVLHQLAVLIKRLDDPDEARPPRDPVKIRVLGPSSSAQYRLMLEGAAQDNDKYPLAGLAATQIYSCKAEAPEEVLGSGISWMQDNSAIDRSSKISLDEKMRKFGATHFQLIRTIRPADELAETLWKELRKRRVKDDAEVAVIAELDSIYGRSTTWAFLRSRPGTYVHPKSFNLEQARLVSPYVHAFTYMAGLDGALPKNALGAQEPKGKDTDGASKTSAPTEDPTEGLSQVDYLRRLANSLAEKDRHLRQTNPNNKGLRAVAVLGSDIYDKLQILRTLRSRLPNAIFLTNNLDARFAHPDEWAETHNLIVASNYDLKPAEEWKSEAPPFRDSLQSAVYAATRMLLQRKPDVRLWVGKPLLFEIGRNGPVRLKFGKKANPPKANAGVAFFWLEVSGCLLLLIGMARLLWPNAHPRQTSVIHPWSYESETLFPMERNAAVHPSPAWHRCLYQSRVMVPVAFLLGLIFTAGRYYAQKVPGEEPFALLAGISIWPGDFLRSFVFLLAVHFVTKTLHDLHDNALQLEKRFSIVEPKERLHKVKGESRWEHFWHNFWPQTEDYFNGGKRVDVPFLSQRYNTWGDWPKRLGRALLLSTLYVLATLLFRRALCEPLPDLPIRGSVAGFSIDILWFAGLSAVFVTFLVVDATELNWRAIRDLNRDRSDWHLRRRMPDFRFENHRRALEPEDCADYLDIEFIARRSDVVNDLVYYPLILLTLQVAARWGTTDDYQWPLALLVGQAATAAWAVYCAVRLPIEANKARKKSLARLRSRLFLRRIAESQEKVPMKSKSSAEALSQVITQIETMKRGAFVGIWDQPVLRALLVPSSSAGVWALIESLPR